MKPRVSSAQRDHEYFFERANVAFAFANLNSGDSMSNNLRHGDGKFCCFGSE